MNRTLAKLNRHLEDVPDPYAREISKAMALVLAAISVGPHVGRLASETGYPESFIQEIANRMQEADLWINGLVDDRDLIDSAGELIYYALFIQGNVALGKIERQKTSHGFLYVDVSTGEIVEL